jgi:hypothetical protein
MPERQPVQGDGTAVSDGDLSVSFTLTLDDYRAFYADHYRSSLSLWKMLLIFVVVWIGLLGLMFGPILISGAPMEEVHSVGDAPIFWFVALGLVISVLVFLHYQFRPKLYYKAAKRQLSGMRMLGITTLSLSRNGVVWSGDSFRSEIGWPLISDVRQGCGHLYLYMGDPAPLIVPLRSFDGVDQAAAFGEALNAFRAAAPNYYSRCPDCQHVLDEAVPLGCPECGWARETDRMSVQDEAT